MHWLALHCPALALEVFAEPPAVSPLAVVDPGNMREPVLVPNAAARAAGIRPGMPRSAASVRAPDLRVVGRDPEAEQAALQRLAAICLRFSDHIAIEPPQDVLLEVGGSRRLFGGFDALLTAVKDALSALGWTVVRGLAPTPAAARLLAHRSGGRIDDLAALETCLDSLSWQTPELAPASAKRLAGWGIQTLGECRALPRAGLIQRLGADFGDWLDRLYGRRSETVPRHTSTARFEGMLPLPSETAELELPLLGLERLTAELEAWLRARDAGIERFAVDLYPPRGPRTSVDIGLASPEREAGHLLALARERLERVDSLPETITAVGLRGHRPTPYVPSGVDLWTQGAETGRAPEPPQRLLERLRARLGPDAVYGLTLQADHRPERAWAWSPPGAVPVHEPSRPASRPLWLLTEPAVLPLDERGQPQCDGPVELLDGPERIETGWWDGDDVERDYFVARTAAGAVLWIYRERRVPQRWFAHGLFG